MFKLEQQSDGTIPNEKYDPIKSKATAESFQSDQQVLRQLDSCELTEPETQQTKRHVL